MGQVVPIQFVPECHADTALALTLLGENQPVLRETEEARLQLRQFVDHELGMGNVGRSMKRQLAEFGPRRIVVGLVDLDIRFDQQPYLREFTKVLGGNRIRKQDSYALLQHPVHTTHYLMVINPAFEMWLLARVAEMGKSVADFGLPTDFKFLKKYCKRLDAEYDPQLRALLDAVAAANLPAYRALAEFVAQVMDLAGPQP